MKVFADGYSKCRSNNEFVFERVSNFEGKGENAGYQQFLIYSKVSTIKTLIGWYIQQEDHDGPISLTWAYL